MWLAIGAFVFVLGAIGYLLFDLSRRLRFSDEIETAIAFFGPDGTMIKLPGYKFSEDFDQTLKAVEAENKAIHSDWIKHPILHSSNEQEAQSDMQKSDEGGNDKAESDDTKWAAITRVDVSETELGERPKSVDLLEEISEFLVLEQLSLHLSSYFQDHEEDQYIFELKRNDIPDFLLSNRVLNLLSTPIEQRDIFINAFPNPKNRPAGEIHSLFGSNGAMYSRFDLNLPSGTKLIKSGNSGFKISTSRFVLDIEVAYTGYHKNIPSGYAELYLGKSYPDISTRSIIIKISGRVKPLSLFRNRGWEYHYWLDSFRERISKDYEFETYFDKINWPIVGEIFRIGLPLYKKIAKANGSEKKPGESNLH